MIDSFRMSMDPNTVQGTRDTSNGSCSESNIKEKITINDLLSENSRLKAQLSSTVSELVESREIYLREADKWRALVRNCKIHSPHIVRGNKAMTICDKKSIRQHSVESPDTYLFKNNSIGVRQPTAANDTGMGFNRSSQRYYNDSLSNIVPETEEQKDNITYPSQKREKVLAVLQQLNAELMCLEPSSRSATTTHNDLGIYNDTVGTPRVTNGDETLLDNHSHQMIRILEKGIISKIKNMVNSLENVDFAINDDSKESLVTDNHPNNSILLEHMSHDNDARMNNFMEIERLFIVCGQDFTPQNVSKILKSYENETINSSLGFVKVTDTSSKEETEYSLRAARAELICARANIDELEYGLKLERKEKQNLKNQLQNMMDNKNSTPYPKQGEKEIALLHNTLSAISIENERLQAEIIKTEWERQKAIESFTALKHRSGEILKGCQEISQATSIDTNATVTKLMAQLQEKTHDIDVIKTKLADAHNQIELMRKSNTSLVKETKELKSRLGLLNPNAAQKPPWNYNISNTNVRNSNPPSSLPLSSSRGPPNNIQPCNNLKHNSDHMYGIKRIATDNCDIMVPYEENINTSSETHFGRFRSTNRSRSPYLTNSPAIRSYQTQYDSSPSSPRGPSKSLPLQKGRCSNTDSHRGQHMVRSLSNGGKESLQEYIDDLLATIDELHDRIDQLENPKSPKSLMRDSRLPLTKTKGAVTKLERVLRNNESGVKDSTLPYHEKDVKRLRLSSDNKHPSPKEQSISMLTAKVVELHDELVSTKETLEQRENELYEGRDLLVKLISA